MPPGGEYYGPAVERVEQCPKHGCGLTSFISVLGEHLANDAAAHCREARVHAGIEIRKPGVIEPHQVKDGCMEVGDMALVFDGREAEFVGRTHGLATFDARSGEPHAEA